ncbi:Lrp/AsnC family transcriptional regulator [Zongyangia hominis]|uniref:Lrp/AsnC family transcriptional regulator n=1 Tax=Zongyangia hominis TaxID=2763677 RepID=A0A926IB12_9FIRM|nr:Lrp/AsnC family transcriptional regulator [Zongyangia hominis]MBC8569655.1 Lrp/AsnC family transcriptional regulator [Zongyangia hominis]
MFLDGLDEMDRRIVELLIHNARISYSDLGSAVGLSRVAVAARVSALEKRGIIEEYTTVINPQRMNGAVSCYFEIETQPACLEEVIGILNRCEIVTQIYRVSGKSKLHVHAVAAGQQEMEDFLAGVIDSLPGVTSLSTNIILSRIKDIKGLRL